MPIKSPSDILPLGSIIHGRYSDYRIEGYLYQDGFGVLYKAVSPSRNGMAENEFVIREHFMYRCSSRGDDRCMVVTPEDLEPTVANFLSMFKAASTYCAKVSATSPGIINVIENIEANNTFYYVVEYLDGETLEDYIYRRGPLSLEEARVVLAPIFDAVKAMHRMHLIHTDIYPRHIRFVSHGNELVPVLFSLYASRHFDERGLPEWDMPAMICREGYAPPEQYEAIDHFAPQVDIYALGALMVFVLSGKHLPDSRTLTEEQIRQTLPAMLPETVVSAIIHALQPEANNRTTLVSNLREDLMEFYGSKKPSVDDRRHVLHAKNNKVISDGEEAADEDTPVGTSDIAISWPLVGFVVICLAVLVAIMVYF